MAINDVKITQLPEIPTSSITDDAVTVIAQDGSNFKMTIGQIKEISKFILTDEPEIGASELSDTSELLVNELEQSKITLLEFMTYVKANIPAIPIHDRGSLRLAVSGTTQTITDDALPVLLTCFDSEVTARGDLVPDADGNSVTYVGTEPIESAIISMGLNVEFPGTEELEIYLYINDTMYTDTPVNMQGNGTGNPEIIFWQSDISLQENDVLTLRGRNADLGSFLLTYLRTTLRVDIN